MTEEASSDDYSWYGPTGAASQIMPSEVRL